MESFRPYIDVVSDQVVPIPVEPPVPVPEVGLRWGEESGFIISGDGSSDDEDAGTFVSEGAGIKHRDITVEWLPNGRPSKPRNELRVFTGHILSPAYIKVRAPDDEESWGIISVPKIIRFTNEQVNPKTKVGKLTTTFELHFTLHPEGEASTPDGQ